MIALQKQVHFSYWYNVILHYNFVCSDYYYNITWYYNLVVVTDSYHAL